MYAMRPMSDRRVWNDAIQCCALSLACATDPLRPDALIDENPCFVHDCSREHIIKQVIALKR